MTKSMHPSLWRTRKELIEMSRDLPEVFTIDELKDIHQAACERGKTLFELIHDAVMEDLYR